MTQYPNGIVKSMLGSADSILGVRDSIGAIIQPVSFVRREYFTDSNLNVAATGPEGSNAKDTVSQVLPSPGMKQFSQDVRLREGGAIKAGDIILTGISKNKYALTDLDSTPVAANVEKFFLIGVKLYQVINITERYVTWDVQVRECTNQVRY